MNTALKVGVARGTTNRNAAKTASDMALLCVVPAALGSFLTDALAPGDAGDDDLEKLARKLLGEQLGFLFGLFVGIRELTPLAKGLVGEGGSLNNYSGPAGLRLVPHAIEAAQQAQQGEFDDAFRKSAINLTGRLFGLPSAQVNRSITGAQALVDGKTGNPAAKRYECRTRDPTPVPHRAQPCIPGRQLPVSVILLKASNAGQRFCATVQV